MTDLSDFERRMLGFLPIQWVKPGRATITGDTGPLERTLDQAERRLACVQHGHQWTWRSRKTGGTVKCERCGRVGFP